MSWGTALQAALAAMGGGASGYARQREIEQARMDREREAQYGREMDAANLARQGFVTPEALAGQREKAGGDVAKMALQSVSSMMNPMAAPPDAALLDRVLNNAGGAFRQGQEITVGGRKLVLPETDAQRGERLDALTRGEARNAAQAAAQQRAKERAEDQAIQAQRDQEQRKLQLLLEQMRADRLTQTAQPGANSGIDPTVLNQAINNAENRALVAAGALKTAEGKLPVRSAFAQMKSDGLPMNIVADSIFRADSAKADSMFVAPARRDATSAASQRDKLLSMQLDPLLSAGQPTRPFPPTQAEADAWYQAMTARGIKPANEAEAQRMFDEYMRSGGGSLRGR